MKSVVDLFLVKDRTAVFWFTMACVSIVLCALFAQKIIKAVSIKPQYVIMDASGTYYLAPSVEFEKATSLHEAQTRLALETLFTRDAENLRFQDRATKLFTPDAIKQIQDEFLNPDEKPFKEQKVVQTVEVDEASIYKIDPRGVALTLAKGRLIRQSEFKGQSKTETLEIKAYFTWRINTSMATNGAFPTICYQIKSSDPKKLSEAKEQSQPKTP
jgi:hypothetical protein